MIKEGLELMLVGMGVVSSFLVLLVLLMKVSGYLFNRTPEEDTEVYKLTPLIDQGFKRAVLPTSRVSKAIAIAAAYQHQQNQGQEQAQNDQ